MSPWLFWPLWAVGTIGMVRSIEWRHSAIDRRGYLRALDHVRTQVHSAAVDARSYRGAGSVNFDAILDSLELEAKK